MDIFDYRINQPLAIEDVISVLTGSGINRPVTDIARVKKMFENADLTISAWQDDRLIGLARSLTDWCYCCYLSDLAVHEDFQRQGIGRQLVALTRKEIGEECMLLLLSAQGAMEYYPRLRMDKLDNAFLFNRTR
jgi:ribosomal protein S18 acetylase RimI-like enzyme